MEFSKLNDLESQSPFQDNLSPLNPQLNNLATFGADASLLGIPEKGRSMGLSFDASLNQYGSAIISGEQVLNLHLPTAKDSSTAAGDSLTGVNPLVEPGDKMLWGSSNNANSSIVFIDSSVEDYHSLIASIKPGTEVAVLDSLHNQVEQIGEYLEGRSNISSLSIISHGDSGSLQLGETKFGIDALNNNSSVQSWSKSLTADADILLYGCDVAQGEQGTAFIQQLSRITGADVAASNDLTGNAALGGDWDLEVKTGEIGAVKAFESATLSNYHSTLAPVSFPQNLTGAGATWQIINDPSGLHIVDASLNTSSGTQSDAFDRALYLSVNNQRFVAPTIVDRTGQTLTSGPVELSGLNVTAEYYADQNQPVLRTFVSFQNSTANSITVPFTLETNVGSDGSTQVITTSTGDTTFTTGDRWVITDDSPSGGDPTNTHVLFGTGNLALTPGSVSRTVFDSAGNQGISGTFNITIPTNSTRSLVFFNGLSTTSNAAQTAVTVFNNVSDLNASGLLSGLTTQQLSQTLNWDFLSPVISLPNGALSYTENDTATVINSGATVTDIDSANFNTGTLTVQFAADSGIAEDRLAIRNQGTAAGEIGVSGRDITYAGTTIGTFTGGTDGSTPLEITFNIDATPTAAQALLQNITYENISDNPNTAARTVSFVLTDGDSGTSNIATKTINVTAVNDAPTVSPVTKTGIEDTAIAFTVADFTGAFSDIEGNTLTQIQITSLPTNGTLTLNGETVTANQEIAVAALDQLSFTPAENFNGDISFNWNGFDGISYATADAAVNLTVTPVNDEPTVTPVTKTGREDTSITFTAANFTGSFSDIEGDTLTQIQITSLPTNGILKLNGVNVTEEQEIAVANLGQLTFTPATNFNGIVSFNWNGFDGTSYAATESSVNLTVTPVNDAPTVSSVLKTGTEDTAITFTAANFTNAFRDIDSNTLTQIQITSLPTNGTLKLGVNNVTANQVITVGNLNNLSFAPNANFNGNVSFNWNGFDGTSYAARSATVNLTVTAVNDAPTVANLIADTTATEDSPFSFQVPPNSFTDVDTGDTLTYTATLDNGNDLPSWLTFDATTLTFSGTPENGDVGTLDVNVTATDSADTSASAIFSLIVSNTNDAPTVVTPIDDQTATEDSLFSFQVDANSFGDVDAGDTLTYTATLDNGNDLPSWLTFDATTLTFSGTPENGDVGTLDVNVTATDSADTSASAIFSLIVSNTNDAPTVVTPIDDQTATEDSLFSFQVDANSFGDVDAGDTLTYTATLDNGNDLPSWLTFDATTLTFSGTPENGDVGTLDVNVTATDSADTSASAIFSLIVSNTNDAPTVVTPIDDQTATEDSLFSFQVDANSFGDVDAGDTLTYTATLDNGNDLPSWLTFDATTLTFSGTPENGDVGTLDVNVTATDSADTSASAIFSLTVSNTNDAPTVVTPIDDQTATEDSLFSFQVDANSFGDVDAGDTLTYTATLDNGNDLPSWLTFDATTLTFSGTPENGDVGTLDVNVTATDSADTSASAIFSLTVSNTNDAPTVSDISKTGDEDTIITFTADDFTDAFNDVDLLDNLTRIQITSLPENGILKLNNVDVTEDQQIAFANLGNLTFTPDENFNGNVNFTWNGFDGTSYAAKGASVNLTVTAVNDAPTLTVPGAKTVNEDTDLSFTGNLITVADVDANSLQVTLAAGNGVLTLGSDTGLTNLTGDGTEELSFTGSVTNINTALNSLVYRGDLNYNGTDTIDVSVNDLGSTGQGGELIASDTISINLNSVNDLPTVSDISKTGNEDTAITFTAADFTTAFSDVDLDSLTQIQITSLPDNGTLTLDGENVTADDVIAVADLDQLGFTPEENFNGDVSFTWNGFDGTGYATAGAAVNLTITAVNDLPTVSDISKTGNEDTVITFTAADFTTAFSDVDLDSLTQIQITSLPDNGTLTLDGENVTADDVIAVADLDQLGFTPEENFNGDVSFTWNGFDGTDFATAGAAVNLTITAVNDLPTVSDISKTGDEDTVITFTAADFTTAFSDVDLDSLTQIQITSLPTNGTLQLGVNNVTANQAIAVADLGNLSFTPNANFNGNVSFNWNGSDGTGFATTGAAVNLTVTAVNDLPTVSNISKTGNEDTVITFTAADFTAAFSDVDLNTLTRIQITTLPTNGTLQLGVNNVTANQAIAVADLGNLSFTPNANFNGNVSFNWNGSDGTGFATAGAAVNLTVTAVNDLPVANSDTATTLRAQPIVISAEQLLANDTDIDGGSLGITGFTQPSNGTLVDNGNNTFTYTPDIYFDGTVSFSYTISDGQGGTANSNVELTVNPEDGIFNLVQSNQFFNTPDITASSVFDESFYLAQNPDVAQAVADGIISSGFEHFQLVGQAEGRDPSILFSNALYLQQNPDVKQAVADGAFRSGFEHFLLFGQNENRDFTALNFDEGFYLENNPDVADAVRAGFVQSGFEHFLGAGQFEGRNPSVLYDESFYLENNPDVADAVRAGTFQSGIEHFLRSGQFENRNPSRLFDNDRYLADNPEVISEISAGAFRSGFEHFLRVGQFEGRQPDLELFNETLYLANNSDVAAAVAAGFFESGFEHFIRIGQTEGRNFSELFDESFYLANNSDVAAAVRDGALRSGFEHYVRSGRAEGRSAVG